MPLRGRNCSACTSLQDMTSLLLCISIGALVPFARLSKIFPVRFSLACMFSPCNVIV